jgi:hypothetical protein
MMAEKAAVERGRRKKKKRESRRSSQTTSIILQVIYLSNPPGRDEAVAQGRKAWKKVKAARQGGLSDAENSNPKASFLEL